ncbi:MAG: DUF4252 domain-containing protein [Flavobacteriaceae bacterium]|nr:DUF4252 domain-containing protein [Flavobacteriaceae bacterium]
MKTIVIVLMLIAPIVGFSQSVFEKYEDMYDVSTVVVTKKLFSLMGKVSGDSPEVSAYKEMILGLENLTVYSTEDSKIALRMVSDVKSFLKSSKMSELVRVKDKEANVSIYIREGKNENYVSELFMFVNGLKLVEIETPKAIIIFLKGDIDLNKISELTSKLDIPGGEHLKKATNK